jgi:DNA-directed RNA polymerase subunit RPC12/RpoP
MAIKKEKKYCTYCGNAVSEVFYGGVCVSCHDYLSGNNLELVCNYCSECGKKIDSGDDVCLKFGMCHECLMENSARVCDVCGAEFEDSEYGGTHCPKCRTGEEKYIWERCEECGDPYTDDYVGNRGNYCPDCNKTFNLHCSKCGKVFDDRTMLVSVQEGYFCLECFSSEQRVCPECGKTFYEPASVYDLVCEGKLCEQCRHNVGKCIYCFAVIRWDDQYHIEIAGIACPHCHEVHKPEEFDELPF